MVMAAESKKEKRSEDNASLKSTGTPSDPLFEEQYPVVPQLQSSTEEPAIPPEKPSSFPSKCFARFIWLIKDQWFLIVMGVLIAISSQVQVPPSKQPLKQNIINHLNVAVIFFINGCTTPTPVLAENLSRWKVHIFVQMQSYLLTSAITFGVISATAVDKEFMDEYLLIGVLVLGCLPTAIAFNVVMTQKSNGNTALTLTQTTVGNILGPLLSTALIKMYTSVDTWYTANLAQNGGGYEEVYRQVFKSLGLSVFIPLAAGQVTVNLFPKTTRKIFIEYKLNKLASLSLLILIWQTYDEAFASDAFSGIKSAEMVYVVLVSFAFFTVWFIMALMSARLWLDVKDTIAVAFVVPTKTPAIGLPLTGVLFAGLAPASVARIRIATVIFQAVQVASSSVLTIPLRRWEAKRRKSEERREEV